MIGRLHWVGEQKPKALRGEVTVSRIRVDPGRGGARPDYQGVADNLPKQLLKTERKTVRCAAAPAGGKVQAWACYNHFEPDRAE